MPFVGSEHATQILESGSILLVADRRTLSAFCIVAALLSPGCNRCQSRGLTEVERRQLAKVLKDDIERAEGVRVWVKTPPYATFPPRRASEAAEVLATSGAFDRVLAIIQQYAQQKALDVGTRMQRERGRWRRANIRLAKGGATASRWLIREVPQLRRASIVIDDLGQDIEMARRLVALPYPLTFSVLPHLSHSAATAEEAHRAGREVMLHLPMEPLPNGWVKPGEGELRVGMTRGQVARILDADLASVPYARGANNHMGSRATADPKLMAAVMLVLAERGLYFVDSRTTGSSVGVHAARRHGVPTFFRSTFLDGTESVSYTLERLREFRRLVEERGVGLAIGHPYPSTIRALAEYLPELARHDIQLVPASHLLELPEVARLEPPRASPGQE